MCGVSGDLFALVWAGGELGGLNSSGCLPAAAELPNDGVPERGIGSVTVPGAPAGWRALAERFGTRPLTALAAPAPFKPEPALRRPPSGPASRILDNASARKDRRSGGRGPFASRP
jgi:gamma-glutamyltranspeptidase/glutathione hydrolase